jgi:hypothetical protein
MTDEQINQRIAEACEWVPDCDGGICWDQHGAPLITPPNYCSDLNAMHEAEKSLTDEQCVFVRDYLRERLENYPASRYIWHATARQRAEAFLRTLGKWDQSGDATEMEVEK